jgi:hypothetical protein
MYKKQLIDLTLVGLKHFFNLDPHIVSQFFLMVLLLLLIFKQTIKLGLKDGIALIQEMKINVVSFIQNEFPQVRLHLARK